MDYLEEIASRAWKFGGVQINLEVPFVFVSGFRMPIYNNFRSSDFIPSYRNLISVAFARLIQEKGISYDIISGVESGSISFGRGLSDLVNKPFIWVRKRTKDYGMSSRIEGVSDLIYLRMRKIVTIEDVISTGKSSISVIQALRDEGSICKHCISIFDYGFEESKERFQEIQCNKDSLLDLDIMLRVGINKGYINTKQFNSLEEWRLDPFNWEKKYGFKT